MGLASAADVYGPNMTRTQARRAISRSRTTAPRAQTRRRASSLQISAALECAECGTRTDKGMVTGTTLANAEWKCTRCALREE